MYEYNHVHSISNLLKRLVIFHERCQDATDDVIEQCDCWAEQVANIEAIKAEDCKIKTAQKNVTDFKVTFKET